MAEKPGSFMLITSVTVVENARKFVLFRRFKWLITSWFGRQNNVRTAPPVSTAVPRKRFSMERKPLSGDGLKIPS